MPSEGPQRARNGEEEVVQVFYACNLPESQKRAFEAAQRAYEELATIEWMLERGILFADLIPELARALLKVEDALEIIRVRLGANSLEELAERALPDPTR